MAGNKTADVQNTPRQTTFLAKMLKTEAHPDPANFYITNPNIGRSVPVEWLKETLTDAMRTGGDALRIHLAKHLNVEIGMNPRANRWPGADLWEAAADPASSKLEHFAAFNELVRRSEVVLAGIDGGGLHDLFRIYRAWPRTGRSRGGNRARRRRIRMKMKRWLAWSHAWCDRGVLTLRQKITPMLIDLDRSGHRRRDHGRHHHDDRRYRRGGVAVQLNRVP